MGESELVLAAAPTPLITDWLTSIGTVGAVIIAIVLALWGDEIRHFGSRVRLVVLFSPDSPDCQLTEETPAIDFGVTVRIPVAVVRFRVGNRGRTAATNIEARITGVWTPRPGGEFVPDPDFLPLNLVWTHTQEITSRVIHRGLPKHCELLQVTKEFGLEDATHTFRFLTDVTPNEVRPGVRPTIKPAGRYRVEVAVSADDVSPIRRTIDINFTGRWSADESTMFGQELVVRLL